MRKCQAENAEEVEEGEDEAEAGNLCFSFFLFPSFLSFNEFLNIELISFLPCVRL